MFVARTGLRTVPFGESMSTQTWHRTQQSVSVALRALEFGALYAADCPISPTMKPFAKNAFLTGSRVGSS